MLETGREGSLLTAIREAGRWQCLNSSHEVFLLINVIC